MLHVELRLLLGGAKLFRGRRLFQCGYPKERHLLEGGVYLRPMLIRGNTVCNIISEHQKILRTRTSFFYFKCWKNCKSAGKQNEVFRLVVPLWRRQ